ncbi:MAG: thiolase family protein [Candidatus Hydrogenedentes bacterium]|nr:thiolase family protein [Candidatus Hydrogenedentota bacterium]
MKDVYVVSATRTAVGRANRGSLAQFRPDEMAAVVLKDAVDRAGLKADEVQDVVMGCAFPEGAQGMNVARIAVARAGLPDSTSAMTINRFCSSGLEAMSIAAAKIRAGMFDVALAGGVESMSLIPMGGAKYSPNPELTRERPEVYIAMGHCGDNVARDFNVSRQEMDEFALRSHTRAIEAIKGGLFKDEIVALDVPTGNGATRSFDTDEGPREDTSLEALAKLRPAFAVSDKLGFCTAGNSSQTSDGAAAVCLMSEEAVKAHGVKPLAKFLGYAVSAGSPKYLGPAQLEAIPKALALSGIRKEDIGLVENNEAFASQCIYVLREMGFDMEKCNVNGGAISLGHPLGCTGCKLSVQIINEMRRRKEKYGLVTMCIGGGMGAAGVFELVS